MRHSCSLPQCAAQRLPQSCLRCILHGACLGSDLTDAFLVSLARLVHLRISALGPKCAVAVADVSWCIVIQHQKVPSSVWFVFNPGRVDAHESGEVSAAQQLFLVGRTVTWEGARTLCGGNGIGQGHFKLLDVNPFNPSQIASQEMGG